MSRLYAWNLYTRLLTNRVIISVPDGKRKEAEPFNKKENKMMNKNCVLGIDEERVRANS